MAVASKLRIGRKGELRLHRADGSSARYGIRIGRTGIMFYDQLRREWHKYEYDSIIRSSDGSAVKFMVEWIDE